MDPSTPSSSMCEPMLLKKNQNPINSVQLKDIQNLLQHFSKNSYKPKDAHSLENEAMAKCAELFRLDYNLVAINNLSGELSSNYPSQLLILEHELPMASTSNSNGSHRTTDTIYESPTDEHKLRDLIAKARKARCRTRFPMPVILYKGKYICRSATLSGGPEIYGRSGFDFLFNGLENSEMTVETQEVEMNVTPSNWELFGKVRQNDIKLLKALRVGTIIDFMVEKKKVKFGIYVTSSEKVDKENRYADFKLISLPYPGCEFFKDYRDNNYAAEGLIFDWSQTFVDATISVPDDTISQSLHTDWSAYTTWDLETITKNYLKLILKYLQDGDSGILIHCISGWDRTPLFVSLLRLNLWADGLIHQNLDAQQILYLTIAYDWMLFGHRLPDRLSKGEEIFFFCFNLLKKLTSDEFSLQPARYKTKMREADVQMEDSMMLDSEMRGSNVSLNSTCSSVSNKSQEFPPMFYQSQVNEDLMMQTNGNLTAVINNFEVISSASTRSPQSKRTSPVTVPVAKLRQRQESLSSVSMGSWQMITGSGSVRDSEVSDPNGLNANSEGSSDSNHTVMEEDMLTFNNSEGRSFRKSKLLKVREIFIGCYCNVIGFRYKLGDKPFGAIFGNFAEKVGLTPARS